MVGDPVTPSGAVGFEPAIPPLWVIVGTLLAWPLGQLAHELSHYLTARVLGVPARLQLSLTDAMRVEFDADAAAWKQFAIRKAPVLIGGITAIAYLARYGSVPYRYASLPPLLFWIAQTLTGGAADWPRVAAWRRRQNEAEMWMLKGGLTVLAGTYINYLDVPALLYVSPALIYTGIAATLWGALRVEFGPIRSALLD